MSPILDPMKHAPVEMRPVIEHGTSRLSEEFAEKFGAETVQRVVSECYTSLREAKATNFLPLFVERFTRQRLKALSRVEGLDPSTTTLVVFVCQDNADLSQIAAGWAKAIAGSTVEVYSGGTDPANEINPLAVQAMAEVGIDIAQEFPKPWTDEVVKAANVIVTIGSEVPIPHGKRHEEWDVPDPPDSDLEGVRQIRDQIGEQVRSLLAGLGVRQPS